LSVIEAIEDAKKRGETDEILGWPGSSKRVQLENSTKDKYTQVSIGRDFWTVLKSRKEVHGSRGRKIGLDLAPPKGFCPNMQELRPNPNIRAHSVKASRVVNRHERSASEAKVFGTVFTTAFDHLSNNSPAPPDCSLEDEGKPTLECLPFKLAYANRQSPESTKEGGSVEGQFYDKNGNKVEEYRDFRDPGFVNIQIKQAVNVGKPWYDDKKWTKWTKMNNNNNGLRESNSTKVEKRGGEGGERRRRGREGDARGRKDMRGRKPSNNGRRQGMGGSDHGNAKRNRRLGSGEWRKKWEKNEKKDLED
jgi:hypothetical protein